MQGERCRYSLPRVLVVPVPGRYETRGPLMKLRRVWKDITANVMNACRLGILQGSIDLLHVLRVGLKYCCIPWCVSIPSIVGDAAGETT